jgi:hypothetical protein
MTILKQHRTKWRRTFLGKENGEFVVWSNMSDCQLVIMRTQKESDAVYRYNLWEQRAKTGEC